jgi:hypothetical protein
MWKSLVAGLLPHPWLTRHSQWLKTRVGSSRSEAPDMPT